MDTPESAIPAELFHKAHCVALIPGVKKVGFGFGGRFGKGVLSCRNQGGETWTGPSAIRVEGGGFGLQIGASSTDVVLLLMNPSAVEKLLASKFTLGADAAVAAGPVGRSVQAQTDAQMHAKILSYSRSRGVFAGVSLEGATLRPDSGANQLIYGKEVSHKQVLTGEVVPPDSVSNLARTLVRFSSPDQDTISAAEKHGGLSEDGRLEGPGHTGSDGEKQGVVKISSEPSLAEVQLGGNFNGLTPRAKAVEPGEYEIVLQKKGFEEWTQVVRVGAGETVTVHADLAAIKAASSDQTAESKQSQESRIRVVGLR
jgi:lipid-binding SYLF domain-containing protein